jgi:hypothetical protein
MRLPALLRAVVLTLLAAALLLPDGEMDGAAPALRVDGARAIERAEAALVADPPPPAVFRSGTSAPSDRELELLAALGRRAPVIAALPPSASGVEARPPVTAAAARSAALPFELRGIPGDTVRVRIADGAGVLDSARVVLDATGHHAGAFRIRPPRGGWREWTVHAGNAVARTGAWVDSGAPPLVVVRAGMPHWESKFVVRALEESGATVRVAYDLGRGMSVAGGGGALNASALADADAVVVLHAAPLPTAERRVLETWVGSGGGLLLVGGHGSIPGFGLASGPLRARSVDGPTVAWTLPPEIAPLPGDPVRVAALSSPGEPFGAVRGAAVGGDGILALRALGRGRVASLGVTESWRWRMEAGSIAEHREFWRTLVDWLAASPRGDHIVVVPTPILAPGARGEARIHARTASAGVPPSLVLIGPGGGSDALRLDPEGSGSFRATFTAADTGVHLLAVTGGTGRAAFRVSDSGMETADAAWSRLALLADRSGGRMVPADSLRSLQASLPGGSPASGLRIAWLLLAAVVAAGGAEWTLRRLRGAA